MTKNRNKIQGVIPAALTPFDEYGVIDFALFEKHLDYLCSSGIHGLFISGTTSEGAYITPGERKELYRTVRKITDGKLPLYVVFLCPHTNQVIREMQDFMELEPDYVAAVTPYYYSFTQEEIIAHFTAIAEASEVPLVLYNIPQNTHNVIEPASVKFLASHPNIAGIKDSSGAVLPFANYLDGLVGDSGSDFAYIQGEDLLDAPSLLLGAPAIVTGLGNVWTEPYVAMYDAARQDDGARVKAEQKRINELAGIIKAVGGKVLPAIKSAVASLGRGAPYMRMVSATLKEHERKEIEKILVSLELLQ
mgnify:FL=1